MKAILEFTLPEDTAAFRLAANADNYAGVVYELDLLLRNRLKHGDDPVDVRAALQAVRDVLNEACQARGIDPWEDA